MGKTDNNIDAGRPAGSEEDRIGKTFNFENGFEDIVPIYLWADDVIFTEEKRTIYLGLPPEERPQFIIEAVNEFYRKNPEYADFETRTIYADPMTLLDFFKNVKRGHFKKAGIEDAGRYAEMRRRIEAAEEAIASNPIDYENIKLRPIWPILRIRSIFTESELAALYYLQHPQPTGSITESSDYYTIPMGPYLYLADYAIAHAAARRDFSYDLTKSGRKKSDRNKQVSVELIDKGFQINETKKGSTHSVAILNQDLIKSTAAMKLFVFLLAKASQQNFSPEIHFHLQELVNIGMYSSINNARAGVENHILAVQALQIAGKMKKGKRTVNQKGGVLFYHHEISNNIVIVDVDTKFNIEYLASYYTALPAWAWSLNGGAFEILLYIFMKSRTERKDRFNVSLSIIRERLALPTKEEYIEKGNKWKPGQYVKQPITDAIENIILTAEANQDENIRLEPHYVINDQSLDEWLQGFVAVTISGEYSEKLKKIQRHQVKKIEDNTKRKEAARAASEVRAEAEKSAKSD